MKLGKSNTDLGALGRVSAFGGIAVHKEDGQFAICLCCLCTQSSSIYYSWASLKSHRECELQCFLRWSFLPLHHTLRFFREALLIST